MMLDSPAVTGVPGAVEQGPHAEDGQILWMDPYKAMYYISAVVGMIGIGVAFYFHLLRRSAADALRNRLLASRTTRWLPTAMENKWYVDEIYIAMIRTPLWVLGKAFVLIDRYLIDGFLVNGTASLPRIIAKWFSPLHNGAVQCYAVSMIGGAVLVALLMFFMPEIMTYLQSLGAASDTGLDQTSAIVGGIR
jgi:NADH-quinone oxidoreductase subunit L